MAKKTNVPLKRRRRSELNVKLIAIIAAVLCCNYRYRIRCYWRVVKKWSYG